LRKYEAPRRSLSSLSDQTGLPFLIAEDVFTTGGSMVRFVEEKFGVPPERCHVIGITVFARNPTLYWVKSLFRMGS